VFEANSSKSSSKVGEIKDVRGATGTSLVNDSTALPKRSIDEQRPVARPTSTARRSTEAVIIFRQASELHAMNAKTQRLVASDIERDEP
jgi:hypothetical protein